MGSARAGNRSRMRLVSKLNGRLDPSSSGRPNLFASQQRDLRIESLRGRIVYLDEVLTMSARLAAATGDPQWEARYRRFDPELDRAIVEAKALTAEAGAAHVVARTQAANSALVGMENKAFELIRPKRLSMVYGIVKQSGGSIEVQSEPGQGTSIQIYFPVTSERSVEPSRARPAEAGPGRGTILLVEDEDGVRSFVRRALQAEGYSVLEAPNGEVAMEVAAAHAGAIGLLMTDIIMPGLSGPELAVQLAQTQPEMKVLFISGYTGDAVLRTGVLDPNAAFLQKPFNPAALALKVRELLNETERES